MNHIVVGTDGSDHAATALRWTVDEAAVHGATVEVLLAWGPFNQAHADRSDRVDEGYGEHDARARDAGLDVVHAWQLPMMTSPPAHVLFEDFAPWRRPAGRSSTAPWPTRR